MDKIVGVEQDHGHKSPLVVLDGTNVARAYGMAWAGMYSKDRGEVDPEPMTIYYMYEIVAVGRARPIHIPAKASLP